MVQMVSVYRNAAGDVFFRLTPTTGRMGKLQVEAQSTEQLERWLADNGFALQFQGPTEMAPVAA
jgi:hypothetical protein